MSRLSRGVMAVAVLACSTNAWAGQARPPAELPRVDVVASVSFQQVPATAGALTHWTGPGFSLTVNGKVTGNVAIAGSVEKFSAGRAAVLAGLQLSTSFYYGSGRDATPGRFFAKFLAGVSGVGSTQIRGAGQIDVGADILLVRRNPWACGGKSGTTSFPVTPSTTPMGAPPSASCSALESEER